MMRTWLLPGSVCLNTIDQKENVKCCDGKGERKFEGGSSSLAHQFIVGQASLICT